MCSPMSLVGRGGAWIGSVPLTSGLLEAGVGSYAWGRVLDAMIFSRRRSSSSSYSCSEFAAWKIAVSMLWASWRAVIESISFELERICSVLLKVNK